MELVRLRYNSRAHSHAHHNSDQTPAVGSDGVAAMVRSGLLSGDLSFLPWIPPASETPPDSRHAVLENSQRFDGRGRNQRARRGSVHTGRSPDLPALLLLPHAGMGM